MGLQFFHFGRKTRNTISIEVTFWTHIGRNILETSEVARLTLVTLYVVEISLVGRSCLAIHLPVGNPWIFIKIFLFTAELL